MIWRIIGAIVCVSSVLLFNHYGRLRKGLWWEIGTTIVALVLGPLAFYLLQSAIELPRRESESFWITGSSKFPIVVADAPFTDKNRIVFKMVNEDGFPVFNVSVRVVNLNAFTKATEGRESPIIDGVLQPIPMTEGDEKIFEGESHEIGTLNGHEGREFYRLDASTVPGKWKDADFVFSFQIRTLTGYGWQQMSWIRKDGELMNKSTLLYTVKGEPTMEQAVSSRNFTDKKTWDYGPIPTGSSRSRWKTAPKKSK